MFCERESRRDIILHSIRAPCSYLRGALACCVHYTTVRCERQGIFLRIHHLPRAPTTLHTARVPISVLGRYRSCSPVGGKQGLRLAWGSAVLSVELVWCTFSPGVGGHTLLYAVP